MKIPGEHLKGRGAQQNVANRFSAHSHEMRDDFLNHCNQEGDEPQNPFYRYFSKNDSQ